MLQFIKLSQVKKEVEIVQHDEPNKFICSKCQCNEIDKLYVIHTSRPNGVNEKGEQIEERFSDCCCENCCPFDILTKYSCQYYLPEECSIKTTQTAQLLKRAGLSKSEIATTLLKI